MSGRSVIVDESYCFEEETHLTVQKTSIFFPGDGFIVYNPAAEIIFRVDSYNPDSQSSKDELVLMDSSGKSLVSVHRKKPSLHQRWEGFLGERMDGQEPIFSVFRASIFRRSDVTVQIHINPGQEYHIEGSFSQRSCVIYRTFADSQLKEVAAEIKRKVDPDAKVVLGKDVFLTCLKPGVDASFVMALVLVLDQIGGDVFADVNGNVVQPLEEDNIS